MEKNFIRNYFSNRFMRSYVFSEQELTKDLEKIGLERGDTVLVHSSLSRIGYVPGGAKTVIGALMRAIGEDGTLIVPTITGQISDSPENPPSFSKNKPSWTGKIPETLRKMEGAFRSAHPTHSVASIGKLAEKITKGHEDALTPCGNGTPYVKVVELEGKILFLGTTLECNTTFHSAEEIARIYYHLQPEPSICKIDVGNKSFKRKMFLHAWGTPRVFAEKEKELVKLGIAKVGYVGRARSVLINAKEMMDHVLQKLEKDRLYLVDVESISFGCINGCIELLRNEKFRSMKINLFLPKESSVIFSGEKIEFDGVKMEFSGNLKLEGGFVRMRLRAAKRVKLDGGYNYWLQFRKRRGLLDIDIIERARPNSFAITGP